MRTKSKWPGRGETPAHPKTSTSGDSIAQPPGEIKEEFSSMDCFALTRKESDLWRCANMIMRDECPPDREYYQCMKEEDDSLCVCGWCWDAYLCAIAAGDISLLTKKGKVCGT